MGASHSPLPCTPLPLSLHISCPPAPPVSPTLLLTPPLHLRVLLTRLQVGSVNNTFGIKGVQEYCNFFKSVEDANALRCRVSECFERASLPGTPPEVSRLGYLSE
jgi:hypothetical protein